MDRAAPSLDSLHALELRVLEGPQRGARAALPGAAPCVLAVEADGRGDGADIVLREPLSQAARVRVTADLPNAMLEVLAGEVQLGERSLKAGEQALWPMHVPLRAGQTIVAFGRACIDDWSAEAAVTAPRESAAAAAAPATPLVRRAEVWLASMGASILLACVGALWMAHVAAAPRAAAVVDEATFPAALHASEFAALQARRSADGRVTLQGRLATLAQRQRLDAWLAQQDQTATIDVRVDEAVAHDLTETFRVNGVSVKAAASAPGRFVAEAAEPNHARLAHAEGIVRRDVQGFETLTVRNSAAPTPPPAPPVPDDPGKRIASLVPGDTAYLVTADGARYFLGAMLPSGHRITQIAKASVTLELNGQQSTLNF